MSTPSSMCPKCNGVMERGFVIDNTHGGRVVSHWAEGEPKRSFWTETKKPDRVLPIGVYRCRGCGFLEAYAREEFAAS